MTTNNPPRPCPYCEIDMQNPHGNQYLCRSAECKRKHHRKKHEEKTGKKIIPRKHDKKSDEVDQVPGA